MSSLVLGKCVTLVLSPPLFSSIKGERSSEFLSAAEQTVCCIEPLQYLAGCKQRLKQKWVCGGGLCCPFLLLAPQLCSSIRQVINGRILNLWLLPFYVHGNKYSPCIVTVQQQGRNMGAEENGIGC